MADQSPQNPQNQQGNKKKQGSSEGTQLGVFIKPPENKPMIAAGSKGGTYNISFRIKLTRRVDQGASVKVYIQNTRIDVVEVKEISDINVSDFKIDTSLAKEIRIEMVPLQNQNQKDVYEFSLPDPSQAANSTSAAAAKPLEHFIVSANFISGTNYIEAMVKDDKGVPKDSDVVIRCSKPFTLDGVQKQAGEEKLRRVDVGRYVSEVVIGEDLVVTISNFETGKTERRYLLKE